MVNIIGTAGGVAQLARASGSYPERQGFESLHRHQLPQRQSYQEPSLV